MCLGVTRGRVIINSHSRELNVIRCNYTWVMYDYVQKYVGI